MCAMESRGESAESAPLARVPALDGLRGLAVLLVLLSHASNVQIFLWPGLDFRGTGRAGVFLFFVLSAYLLTAQFLDRDPRALRGWRPWVRYAVRRLLRIYPAYCVCLFLHLALKDEMRILELQDWTLGTVGEHLAMIRGELHLWTVPVEVGYYLVLPLIVLVLLLLRGRPALALATLVIAAVTLRLWHPPDYGSRPPDFEVNLLPFLPVFLAGSAGAVAVQAWRRSARELHSQGRAQGNRARRTIAWDVAAVVSGIVLLLHAPSIWSQVSGEFVEHTVFHMRFGIFALLWSVLLVSLLCGSGWLRRPFEWRALRWVGRVSYSTYLFHRLILVVVELRLGHLGGPWAGLAFLTGSLLAGWLSYRFLERPFMRLWARPERQAAISPRLAEGGGAG